MLEEELIEFEEKKRMRKALIGSFAALVLIILAEVVYSEGAYHISNFSSFRYLLYIVYLMRFLAFTVAIFVTKDSIIQLKSSRNGKIYVALLISLFVIASIVYGFVKR